MAESSYLVLGLRTPIGSLNGSLAGLTAPQLGATCVRQVIARSGIPHDAVDEVIMGNVVGAGVGQNPARQASLGGGLPPSVGATTVNKVCGSGLKAVMLADQSVRLGEANLVIAGGMESMTAAPYLLPKARQGYRLGHGELLDATIQDGLWDVYGCRLMGTYGEQCAEKFSFSRQAQDDFAVRSYTRAIEATQSGFFAEEMVPVEVPAKRENIVVSEDEEPQRFNEEKLRGLRPAFDKEGTITAGNASSINDGAAALLVASQAAVDQYGLEPVAKVVAASTFSQEPEWFTTAPIGAIRKLIERVGWQVADVDVFEINEAFAAVAMAAEKELEISEAKVNPHGGAVGLGHPIGCSGARILVTLLNGLKYAGGRRGIASLCIGGGEAVAVAVERVE